MNTPFVQEMKKLLDEEKKMLEENLASVSSPDTGDHVPGTRVPTFPDYGRDNLGENTDSPAEVAAYSVNVDVTGQFSSRLEKVNQALARIEEGSYGNCLSCASPIGEDRLQANASADLCMACAGKNNL